MTHSRKQTVRRGQVAPLTALLIVPIMGMMAFSVDLGYAVVVNTQLQNAADAAALAGAQQLMDPNVAYFTPGNSSDQKATILSNAVSSAKKTAKAVATYNTAGTVNIALLDSDISVGYLDSNGTFTSSSGLASGTFPNTVRVTARRDSTSNGALNLFFGRVFNKNSISMSCFAQASNYVVNFSGVNSITQNLNVLPLAYDRSTWKDIFN